MPTYVFKNNDSGEVFEHFVKLSEVDQYLADHPNYSKVVTAPHIGYSYQTKKLDGGFKEVLSKINESGIVDPKKSSITHLL